MKRKNVGINTICAHVGEVKDDAVSGSYFSFVYAVARMQYENGVMLKDTRGTFNTPNQEGIREENSSS